MNEISVNVKQEPGKITRNFEEIKTNLEAALAEYTGMVYDDDSIKSAKTDVATLRALAKTIEDRRKEVKEKCLEPYGVIEKQAKELVAAGAKELILVAQETTLYGVDLYGEKSLHRLLDELNKIDGLFWIRIMYCYPEEIYEDLIDAMIRNEKVCHYLDIPIQHANSDVLKRMGRKTNKDDLVCIIHHLREEIPDITLRTTLICGFPGETEEQHKELLEFVQEMKFDRLGAFTYSPEEGTKAAEMENQIPEETKKLWQQEVMELQEEIIFEKNEDMVDRELYAFIEGKVADENAYVGRTYRDAPSIDGYIFVNTEENLMTGDFAKVKVTGAYEYDLIGELA